MTQAPTRNCTTCPTRVDGIFCSLPPAQLAELNRHKTTNHYHRGQTLFYEGTPPTGLFCVGTGKVKVMKNGTDGKDIILRVAGEGDVLGCGALLTDQNHRTTAEVIEDAEICFVDKKFLSHLVAEDAALAFNVIKRLVAEARMAERRLSDLLNKDVRQRLIRLLLALHKTHGMKEANGGAIDVRLTRQEIGSMMDATPETVIRLLSGLNEEGLVHLDGKKIYLKDLPSLAREAELED